MLEKYLNQEIYLRVKCMYLVPHQDRLQEKVVKS